MSKPGETDRLADLTCVQPPSARNATTIVSTATVSFRVRIPTSNERSSPAPARCTCAWRSRTTLASKSCRLHITAGTPTKSFASAEAAIGYQSDALCNSGHPQGRRRLPLPRLVHPPRHLPARAHQANARPALRFYPPIEDPMNIGFGFGAPGQKNLQLGRTTPNARRLVS